MKTRNKDVSKFVSKHNLTSLISTSQNKKLNMNVVYSLKPEQFFLPKDIQLNFILRNMRENNQLNSLNFTDNSNLSSSTFLARRKIMSKIKEFTLKYRLTNSTYYMASFYLDILITKRVNLPIDKIGIGSLLLAMKYHDMDGRTPSIRKFVMFFSISQKELCMAEIICLQNLEYVLTYSHISNFIQIISIYGIIYSDDDFDNDKIIKNIYESPYILLDKVLDDGMDYLEFDPFNLALSIICIIRENLDINIWNKAFNKYYQINFSHIKKEYNFVKG